MAEPTLAPKSDPASDPAPEGDSVLSSAPVSPVPPVPPVPPVLPVLEDSGNDLRARDRVLLYMGGMDVEPILGLEIALDSLRRAGPQAGPAAAMRELYDLLQGRGLSSRITDADGQLLCSVPPMNRSRMIPEEMDRLPFLTSLKRRLRGQ
jgi:hypothetical protein